MNDTPSQRSGAVTAVDAAARHRPRGRVEVAVDRAPELALPAWMLSAVVIGSVLAVGTVHFPVLVAVAVLAFATAALTLHRSPGARLATVLPWPAALCAALALYTLLQAAPLPMSWLRAIAPATADVWARSLLPLGDAAPRWASISLDPGASLVEALKWSVYGAVFAVSATIAAKRGAVWGVTLVFASGVVVALATLGHGLAGATKVYGLYAPTFMTVPWHVSPLLNTNNLAGYLNLAALSGLGLLLAGRPTLPKWVIAPGVTAIIGIEITSASRAGVFVLPVGVLALAVLARRREHAHDAGGRASTWVLLLAAAGGGVLAVLGGTWGLWAELLDKDLSKLSMVSWVKPMLRDHGWLGIGRGAFESVFPAYRHTPGNVVFTHAENFPAQWASEWGVPIGLAALGAFAWALGPRKLGVERSSIVAGAWIGVMVLLAQNLLDLGIEVPAVSIALAVAFGSLWGARPRGHRRVEGPARELTDRGASILGAAVAVVGLGVVALALPLGARDIVTDRFELRDALGTGPGPTREEAAALRRTLRAAIARHPADPYFALVGALIAFRAADGDPIPWIQRTLERAPVNGRAHYLLAQILATRGARRQALLELRLAIHDDPALVGLAAGLAVQVTKDFDELLQAAPDGKEGAAMLSAMADYLPAGGVGARCDREAILRDPAQLNSRLRQVEERLAALAPGSTSTLCADRRHCHDEILEHVEAIAALAPERSWALQLRARLLAVMDKPLPALRLLQEGCDPFVDRAECLATRVRIAGQVKAPEALDAAAKDLLGTACASPSTCAETSGWLGDLRASRGENGAALVLYSRAARDDALSEGRWLKLATAASAAGAHAEAAEALERVAQLRGGADGELKQRIAGERDQAMKRLLTP